MSNTANFWKWFKEHKDAYLFIDNLEDEAKENLLDDLLDQLHLYCDKLYFQVGGTPGEEQELIITAEGNVDYFEQVELLIVDAPAIEGWKFIAFLQPQGLDPLEKTNYEDVELVPAEMWFMPLNNARKPTSIGIKVCPPNYESIKDSEWLEAAVFKCLAAILGEKNFGLDIDFVDIGELPELPEKHGMIELVELPAYLTWKKKQLNRDE